MKKTTAIEIIVLFIAGLIPILWLRSGYFVATGDDFPLFINPLSTFKIGLCLWTPNYLGFATPTPAYALYLYPTSFLGYLGLDIGSIQTLVHTVLLMLGGFSMYFFAKTVYPNIKIAAFAAGFFYVFNFFALENMHNIGFVWIYAFLPLLLALFARIMNATFEHERKTANKNIIYFALTSVLAFSFASINAANLALLLIGLAILFVFYLIKFRKQLRLFFASIGKTVGLTIPINLWWIIPVLNYYFISSSSFNSSVSISDWTWTQARSSFLNLFRLNGFWGWNPTFVPSNLLSDYSNPALIILTLIPILVAASSLFFKGEKRRFNLYIMAAILALIFLAKGVHDPFGQLNLLLYQLPLASMFREPVSKFTLLTIPFLALLVGFGVASFTNLKIKRLRFAYSKSLVLLLMLILFFAAVFPLVMNPLQSETAALPYSSYVKIPNYWYQAANWINNQPGNGKVLLTPLDDFYQMPYVWGYYGTDQLIDGLIDKPIISTDCLFNYKIDPGIDATLENLSYTIQFDKGDEFKSLLDVLGVQYILQRNDINSNMANQTTQVGNIQSVQSAIMSPAQMKAFLITQPYLRLVKTFGDLDIYEYLDAKPAFFAVSSQTLEQSSISFQGNVNLREDWNFSDPAAIGDWQFTAYTNTSETASPLSQNGSSLESDLYNSTGYIGEIDSPLLTSTFGSIYTLETDVSGENTSNVNIVILQYASDMALVGNSTMDEVNYGTFGWTNSQFSFELLPNATDFRIQVWFDMDPNWVNHAGVLIKDINVTGETYALNNSGVSDLFSQADQNQTAVVLNQQYLSPSKYVVTVDASGSFVLGTSEAFNKFWQASVNGQQISPVPLYLGFQGFPINQTGQLQITIEYEPQVWFNYAATISILSVMCVLALFLYIERGTVRRVFKKSPVEADTYEK